MCVYIYVDVFQKIEKESTQYSTWRRNASMVLQILDHGNFLVQPMFFGG